ncbi:MAG: hypothetical protein JXB26_09560 [Candidatus Aminicenantes bacterium]|nr:hypothetical protein [Candidatus Aminicenantes bacterium]
MRKWKLSLGLVVLVFIVFLPSCDLFKTGQGYVLHVFNETEYKVQVYVDDELVGDVEAQGNEEFGDLTQSAASQWRAQDTEGRNLVWEETQNTTTADVYDWYLRVE